MRVRERGKGGENERWGRELRNKRKFRQRERERERKRWREGGREGGGWLILYVHKKTARRSSPAVIYPILES